MRIYLYARNQQDVCTFITTFLNQQDAKEYAKKHSKVFRGVYKEYLYGSMSDEMDKWTVYKTEKESGYDF